MLHTTSSRYTYANTSTCPASQQHIELMLLAELVLIVGFSSIFQWLCCLVPCHLVNATPITQ